MNPVVGGTYQNHINANSLSISNATRFPGPTNKVLYVVADGITDLIIGAVSVSKLTESIFGGTPIPIGTALSAADNLASVYRTPIYGRIFAFLASVASPSDYDTAMHIIGTSLTVSFDPPRYTNTAAQTMKALTANTNGNIYAGNEEVLPSTLGARISGASYPDFSRPLLSLTQLRTGGPRSTITMPKTEPIFAVNLVMGTYRSVALPYQLVGPSIPLFKMIYEMTILKTVYYDLVLQYTGIPMSLALSPHLYYANLPDSTNIGEEKLLIMLRQIAAGFGYTYSGGNRDSVGVTGYPTTPYWADNAPPWRESLTTVWDLDLFYPATTKNLPWFTFEGSEAKTWTVGPFGASGYYLGFSYQDFNSHNWERMKCFLQAPTKGESLVPFGLQDRDGSGQKISIMIPIIKPEVITLLTLAFPQFINLSQSLTALSSPCIGFMTTTALLNDAAITELYAPTTYFFETLTFGGGSIEQGKSLIPIPYYTQPIETPALGKVDRNIRTRIFDQGMISFLVRGPSSSATIQELTKREEKIGVLGEDGGTPKDLKNLEVAGTEQRPNTGKTEEDPR
jgi:hypothetical protein